MLEKQLDLKKLESRIKRIETRLAQLMVYLGANPYDKNVEEGFFVKLDKILDRYNGEP